MGQRNPGTVGRNLREFRKNRGLSQWELAALSRVSRSTVALLESGARRETNTQILKKLAAALKRPIEDLFREEPKSSRRASA